MMVRTSANGFYCASCRDFVYKGYDYRDHNTIEKGKAYCTKCFKEEIL